MGLAAFLNGASPEYSLILRSKDPASVQEASRMAQNEELTLKFQNLSASTFKSPSNNNNYNNNRRVFTVEQKFCRYCKRSGHLIEQCRKREYNNQNRMNSNSNNKNFAQSQSRSYNQSKGFSNTSNNYRQYQNNASTSKNDLSQPQAVAKEVKLITAESLDFPM